MYAQLFYISDEDNHYPQTDMLFIDDSLHGLLSISAEHDGNNAYWAYYDQSERQSNLSGGLHITDFNTSI